MSQLDSLFGYYPEAIAEMPHQFDSHQFILFLAEKNQALYIQALSDQLPRTDPFRVLHAELSKKLHTSPLVRSLGRATSPDIFGHPNECGLWEKV